MADLRSVFQMMTYVCCTNIDCLANKFRNRSSTIFITFLFK